MLKVVSRLRVIQSRLISYKILSTFLLGLMHCFWQFREKVSHPSICFKPWIIYFLFGYREPSLYVVWVLDRKKYVDATTKTLYVVVKGFGKVLYWSSSRFGPRCVDSVCWFIYITCLTIWMFSMFLPVVDSIRSSIGVSVKKGQKKLIQQSSDFYYL